MLWLEYIYCELAEPLLEVLHVLLHSKCKEYNFQAIAIEAGKRLAYKFAVS